MSPIQQQPRPTVPVLGIESMTENLQLFVEAIENGRFTKEQSVLVAVVLNQIVVAGQSIQMLLAGLK